MRKSRRPQRKKPSAAASGATSGFPSLRPSCSFTPLRKAIGTAQMLYLAPDGALNRLPFEALVDDAGKYLVESYRCAYLSSGRDLLRPAPPAAKGTVVFAAPDYTQSAEDRLAQAEKLLGKKQTLAMRGFAISFFTLARVTSRRSFSPRYFIYPPGRIRDRDNTSTQNSVDNPRQTPPHLGRPSRTRLLA